jgi:leucine dehydrogenase
MEMDLFGYMKDQRFGRVHVANDEKTGLRAIVAVHSTTRGPGIGGCRAIRYPNTEAAMRDAMRLGRGMSYKAACAGLNHGGAKAVIMLPDGEFDREALFTEYGKFVDSIGGDYITCEDSGTSTGDMDVIARQTKHVLGTSNGSCDPSPYTAYGCRRGLEAAVKFQLGKDSLKGLHIAFQGVGNVGFHMAREVVECGAHITVADVNQTNVQRAVDELGAKVVGVDEILGLECDVLAPCALGAILDDTTIPNLKTRVIAGAANNMLAEDRHGDELHRRGILYAPDYVINAGGLINVASEYSPAGWDHDTAWAGCTAIFDTLIAMFERSRSTDTPTHIVADQVAEERIFID